MLRLRSGWLALFAAAALVLSGCSSPPPIALSLSPASPQAIDQGLTVAITATLANDSSAKGVTWKLSGQGTLSATAGSSINYIAPTSGVTSVQKVTVTATSAADPSKTASLAITVNPLPEIPIGQKLADGTVGEPYSAAIALVGGTAPFQWSIYDGPVITGYQVGGAVPDGLTLDPVTGKISGTPTAAGTWYFEGTAVDADNNDAVDGFLSIQIHPKAEAAKNPIPFLNQPLVPTAIAPGSPAFTINVSGTGFVSGATVHMNGDALKTTFVDSGHLSALVPAAKVATAETALVTAVNPAPGGGASNAAYFQVAAPGTTVRFARANFGLQKNLPFGITTGDFNEDGKPDLAVAADASVFVFSGNGDGTFQSAPGSPMRVASPPYNDAATPINTAIVAADFNHSGHLGLAVADLPNAAAYILLGNGDGTFTASSAAFADSFNEIAGMTAADLNGDGNLDLAFQALVVLGYGDGAFSGAGRLYASGFQNNLVLGDFNQDGKLDAIVASGYTQGPGSSGSGLAVSLGQGDGNFTLGPNSPLALGDNLAFVIAADFNGDGKLDVAVADSAANTVIVLPGNGDGTFGAPVTIAVGKEPISLAVGDFNNDGKLDLAIANFAGNTVTLLLGNGDGTFTEASGSPYATGKGPLTIAAADFNGDGKLDLAVGNITDGTASILLQQ